MQKLRKALVVVLLCLIASLWVGAQLTIESVYKVNLRNVGVIKEGAVVKGYYFFFVSDKIDKKTNQYTLQITGSNLEKLKDIKFADSKNVIILESSFNGSDLIFLLYNEDERKFEYQIYGANGNKKFTYARGLSKKEVKWLENSYFHMSDDEGSYKGLFSIEGKGFISNTPSREDRDYTFQVDYFSTETNKHWSYIPSGGKGFWGDYLGCFNGMVYMGIFKTTSLFDTSPEYSIIALSLETGKLVFEMPADNKRFKVNLATLYPISDTKALFFGEYFDPSTKNVFFGSPLGYACWEIDANGKIKSEKYISWEFDLSRHLNVSAKGKVEEMGYLFLHNLIPVADGSFYLVAEGYQSKGGFMQNGKAKVTDMVLMQLDNKYNIKSVKLYEKKPNNIDIPAALMFGSSSATGKVVKYILDGFDYMYILVDKEGSSFSIYYSDYLKGKDYKGGTFNSISYNDGKITTDRINTKSDASETTVLPGKLGQVLVLDYYKKEKRLNAHFEKLN